MNSKKWSLCFIALAFLFTTSTSTSTSAKSLIHQVTEDSGTSNNGSYSLEGNLGGELSWREERPSSKILTITSFSVIKESYGPYVSSVFEAVGYKWRLVLYLKGNSHDSGEHYISLYVRIEDTGSLPKGWEVNVDLKLFIYNGNEMKYATVTDGLVKRYSDTAREWGNGQLINLTKLYTEGFIAKDTVTFGAEISVVKPAQVQEKVIFISYPPNNVFTWKLTGFSTLKDKNFYYSQEFLVGDRYWILGFNPKRHEKWLTVFIYARGFKPDAVVTTTWCAANLRLKNQRGSNHKEGYTAALFPIPSGLRAGGVDNIISFTELYDLSKGYMVNDTVLFEAELVQVSVTRIVPA